jgi:flavin reductase (DIM6/NTAB) family NADH-FMN oxidoreductase RutF
LNKKYEFHIIKLKKGEKSMKKITNNKLFTCQPIPKLIVSCRNKEGRNNALVVGFAGNVSIEPPMVMIGVVPDRFSYPMIKETGCFVVNLTPKSFSKEYNYLGSTSGAKEDKFAAMNIQYENGTAVNAPVLNGCPVSIECSVVDSIKPGTHELFIGKVECVHCDEEYLDSNGNIDWSKLDLL